MQKLKIYGQKKENGDLDYYTNLYHKDKETEKMTFKKLKVGFRKGEEMLGHIHVKESSLTFSKIKLPMELTDMETKKPVQVEVPYTAYKLFIWAYEKTAEDEQKDVEFSNEGRTFIKEYVSPEEKKARFEKAKSNYFQEQPKSEQVIEEDLDAPELPF